MQKVDISKILVYVLIFVLCAFASFVTFKKISFDKEITQLRNQLTEKENTVEIQKGLFVKKALEVDDLKKFLSNSSEENAKLLEQVNKSKESVVQLTNLNIQFKKNYESKVTAKQSAAVENGIKREKVEFEKEFDIYKVGGYTLTNPAEAFLKLSQTKPLTLSIALTQNKDNTWKVYSSGNDNFSVDIKLAAINPLVLDKKWYERIGLVINIGGGTIDKSGAALLGFGLSYDFYKFTLGPNVWFFTTGKSDRMYRNKFYMETACKVTAI